MTRRLGLLVLLGAMAWAEPGLAEHEPARPATAPAEQDADRCAAAETAEACRAALPACERAVAALSRSPSPAAAAATASLTRVLLQSARCTSDLGNYPAAEGLYRRALATEQRLYGPEHVEVAKVMSLLAETLERQSKYDAAELFASQALAMRKKLLGRQDPAIAESLISLAYALAPQDKREQAEPLFREAMAILEAVRGPEHPDTASVANDLALLLVGLGKFEIAESLARKALKSVRKSLGDMDIAVAVVLNTLAEAIRGQGRYEEAETFYRQALELTTKLLGPEHPIVATGLNNLAVALMLQGKYEQSEQLLRQTLALRQKLQGTDHVDVAACLNNLAKALLRQGKTAQAEPLYRQALLIQQKLFGPNHPHTAKILQSLAELSVVNDQLPDATRLLQQVAEIRELGLRSVVSETRMLAALETVRQEEDVLYGLLLAHPDDTGLQRLALSTALLRKGRAAEVGEQANQILHQHLSNPALRERFEKWQGLRAQREKLLFGGLGRLTPDAYREQLASLAREADDLEGLLAQELPELRALKPPAFDQVIAAVAASLPRHGALLEVIHTTPMNLRAQGTEPRWGKPHYLAIVLSPEQKIAVHDLGMAEEVEALIQALLVTLRSPSSEPRPSAAALFRKVLAPALPKGVTQLFLSLDAALNLVPFDALNDGKDYLVGRLSFHYLTSGRDLLRRDGAGPVQTALVLADPDFASALPEARPGATAVPSTTSVPPGQVSAGNERGSFYSRLRALVRLPGAQKEAVQIAELLAIQPHLGAAATETLVRNAGSPWVLHIATHGLFLHDRVLSPPRSGSSRDVELPIGGGQGTLSRSAIVLAGAARGQSAASADQDGLLTAEEARSLSFFGTQLVVLSACDTGQGDLSVGQGVYGLRRAFLVAGAETLVTSLWQVNDEATGKLMALYYRNLLRKKQGRLLAMQQAMTKMRKQYAHPYYWAPFLVLGSDKPLRLPLAR